MIALTSRQVDACCLEIERQGFSTVSEFLSREACERIQCSLDAYLLSNRENAYSGQNRDSRVFCSEYISEDFAKYKHDAGIRAVASKLGGARQASLLVMSNRVAASDGRAIRSGGRWHRDRKKFQFKSIVYLSDVSINNGPFSLLKSSREGDSEYRNAVGEAGFAYSEQRWNNAEIEPFLALTSNHIETFTAAKGTLILFDSSNIHCGRPLIEGERYAMTNYFYDHKEIDLNKFRNKWDRRAGEISFGACDCLPTELAKGCQAMSAEGKA